MNSLWLLCVIGLLAWYWLDSARARELATGIARSMCRKRGLQFLDDTVSQVRFGIRWTGNGIRLRRMFSFDFSREGVGRRSGWLILLGTSVEQFDLGLPKYAETPVDYKVTVAGQPPQPKAPVDDNKVVPFKRPKQ